MPASRTTSVSSLRRPPKSAFAIGALASLFFACATVPPPAPPAPPPVTPPGTTVEVERTSPPAAPPPSAEELEKTRAREKLAAERSELHKAHEAELARLTPELRAQAKTLAETRYPSAQKALAAVIASPTRSAEDRARDAARHPLATLTFAGFQPNQTVFEYGPGQGWYTALLAPALAARGKLIVNNGDPNGPADARSTFYAERVKLLLETSPELYGKVETVTVSDGAPALGHDNSVDLALVFRGLHGMVNQGSLDSWLSAMHTALKPKGVLVVEQHRAKADVDALASAKQGYLPEAWVISRIEGAGFKLVAKSEVNANPRDTKDYPGGVWTLPPSLAQGDKDREKYLAIGESDRMTLKFVKVSRPAAKAESKAGTLPKDPSTSTLAPTAAPEGPRVPAAAAPSAPAEPATEKL